MRRRVQARLAELRLELERGQAEVEQLERRTTYLREMLLRIGGAAQVLEELLAEPSPASDEVGTASDGLAEAAPARPEPGVR